MFTLKTSYKLRDAIKNVGDNIEKWLQYNGLGKFLHTKNCSLLNCYYYLF